MSEVEIDWYLKNFSGNRRVEALKYAHDIRKFEIDLYWKRAAYFWAFIGVAFAGYFAIQKDGDLANVFVVACLGFLFSLGWYLVNRASASWQRNWERHVDLLEDGITGPLYKTLLDRDSHKFSDLSGPYSYSPSRINNVLAFSVTLIWAVLIIRTGWKAKQFLPFPLPDTTWTYSGTLIVVAVITIVFAGYLLFGCRARNEQRVNNLEISVRTYVLSTHPPSVQR